MLGCGQLNQEETCAQCNEKATCQCDGFSSARAARSKGKGLSVGALTRKRQRGLFRQVLSLKERVLAANGLKEESFFMESEVIWPLQTFVWR